MGKYEWNTSMRHNWIKCSDSMPEEKIDVLVRDKNKDVYIGGFGDYFGSGSKKWIICNGDTNAEYAFDYFSHWMTIPEFTEENKFEDTIINKVSDKSEIDFIEELKAL